MKTNHVTSAFPNGYREKRSAYSEQFRILARDGYYDGVKISPYRKRFHDTRAATRRAPDRRPGL